MRDDLTTLLTKKPALGRVAFDPDEPFSRGLAITVFSYTLIYGLLLYYTGGMPYVMDNNESFSSLWHARNLFDFGLSKSVGLADESFSPHAEAHPYVHTHQGNFPRLFAYLIYVLGAQSIESQIVVTTFTVGLAAVALAYYFFARIANPLLGTLAALVLMTDYVLVGQWQVVTYRVWHEFFLFSSLLCVHGVAGAKRGRWFALTVLNYACLFYFELVFVAFVSLTAALYAAYLYTKSPRNALLTWAAQGTGAVIALGLLLTQLVLYMGWDNAAHDAVLTFKARNLFSDHEDLVSHIREFYDFKHIIFWYNLEDGDKFRSLGHFVATLTYYDFQPHTPFFTYVTLTLCTFFGLATLIPERLFARLRRGPYELSHLDALIAMPVLAPLCFAIIHILHKLIRGDAGLVLAILVVSVVVTLVGWSVYYRRMFLGCIVGGPADFLATKLHRATRIVGLLVVASVIPSIVEHISSNPLLFDKYSMYFGGFVMMLVALAVYLAYGLGHSPQWDDLSPQAPLVRMRGVIRFLAAWAALLLIALVFLDNRIYLGQRPNAWTLSVANITLAAALYASTILVAFWLARHWKRAPGYARLWAFRFDVRSSIAIAVGSLMFTALALGTGWFLFNPSYVPIWDEILDSTLPRWQARALLASTLVLGVMLLLLGPRRLLGRREDRMLRSVAAFLATGFIAYAVVFYLSPGYIFSGYRFRIVPFTAFHTDLLIAISFYLLARSSTFLLQRSRILDAVASRLRRWVRMRASRTSSSAPPSAALLPAFGAVATGIMFISCAVYWLGMQVTYLRLFPPDYFAIFSELQWPPYRGQTFAANGYAAPIAAFTNQWAYLDQGLIEAELDYGGPVPKIKTDDRYLWFADRHENDAYGRPKYYFCLIMQSYPSVAAELAERKGRGSGYTGCADLGLVRLARSGAQNVVPHVNLTAIDEEGPRTVGYARWAIVSLDWPDEPLELSTPCETCSRPVPADWAP